MQRVALGAVSRTAVGVARVRAYESSRDDRLFDDPYAAAFVAAAGTDGGPREQPTPERRRLAFHIIIRTRYYDDYLLDAAESGCRQVVLLAAGLDARGFRLGWPPGTRLFEIDLPEVLAVKEGVLADQRAQPRCERHVVAADLTGDWLAALTAAGFDPGEPTAWLVEGLLVYLARDDARALLTALTGASASGSTLAFERGSGAAAVTARDTDAVTSLWRDGAGADVAQWLAGLGWDVTVDNLGDVARALDRPTSQPTESAFLRLTKR
jgi:methyltransferase (TIGR00027 family)